MLVKVGQKLLLSTAELNLKVLSVGTPGLAPKWCGPFDRTERIGMLATDWACLIL